MLNYDEIIEGKDVKQLRVALKMTQAEFANYFGIPKRTLEDWERQKRHPSLYIVDMIKRILYLEEKYSEGFFQKK